MTKIMLFLFVFLFSGISEGSVLQYNKLIHDGDVRNFKSIEECASEGNVSCKLKLGFYYLYGGRGFNFGASQQVDYFSAKKYLHDITGCSPLARLGLAKVKLSSGKNKEAYALIKSAAVEGLADAKAQLAFPSEEGGRYIFIDFDMNLYWSRSLLKDFPDDDVLRGNMGLAMVNNKNKKWWNEGFDFIYETAYNRGSIIHQEELGDLYAEGRVTPRDYVMAYMMYDLAGTGGLEKKQALAKKLTPEQIEDALNRSHEWQRAHHSYRPNYESGSVPIHWNMHRE